MNIWIHPEVVHDFDRTPQTQCERLIQIIKREADGLADPLGEVKVLDRALDGWLSAKPTADARAADENEVRAVFQVEDGQATLLALGARDMVYVLARKRCTASVFIQAQVK